MGSLLFIPSGRISAAEFTRGAYVLIIIGVFIHLSPRFSTLVHGFMALGGVVLIWCWIVLCIKRFRDGGDTGWKAIMPIGIYIVGYLTLSGLIPTIFAPEMQAEVNAATETALETWDSREIMRVSQELGEPMSKKMALPMAVSFLCLRLFIVFVTNRLAGHDAGENKYGPETEL